MSKEFKWRITRIRGNRADRIGVVEALDAKAAIQAAIKKFDVKGKQEQARIAAMQEPSP